MSIELGPFYPTLLFSALVPRHCSSTCQRNIPWEGDRTVCSCSPLLTYIVHLTRSSPALETRHEKLTRGQSSVKGPSSY
ncbi:hypothetical protein BJX64DRAFT_245694 [Aspergillus heterothallicus]